MKTYNIYMAILVCIAYGCNKNDDSVSPEIALQNEPPLSFNLIDVADNTTNVDVMPTLTWESAKNPDGSDVTYDIYLGKEINPTNLHQSSITETFFEISERLNLITDYYWKVVASDTQGKTSQSAIHKFTTRNLKIPSAPLTEDTGFAARNRHSSTVFDDKVWVIAGSSGAGANNLRSDVWFSSNGLEWKEATAEAEFPKRNVHSAVAFDNKLWIIGGYDGDFANDVWYSDDGINWTEAVANAPFSPRYSHTATVFDNKIWVIGGNSESGLKNDIWYSENGADWVQATNSAPFEKRSGHGVVVFRDKLWLAGGSFDEFFGFAEDVWLSEDGINWIEVTTTSPPPGFTGRNLLVFDDALWILGGVFSGYRGQAWYSRNGQEWIQAYPQEPLLNRSRFSISIFNNKIWLIAGQDNAVHQNDVWILE